MINVRFLECQWQVWGGEEEEVVSVDNISWLGQDSGTPGSPQQLISQSQLGSWQWSNQSALARRHDDTDVTRTTTTATASQIRS